MNNFKNIVLAISLTTSFGFYASAQNKCAETFKKEKEQAWVESDYMKESDVLKGSLSVRVDQFIAKYPKNAKLQKAVKLKLKIAAFG